MSHLRENNETYIGHLLFAGKIAVYLSLSSTFFLIHSVLPFIKIPDMFNLNSVCSNAQEWCEYASRRRLR